MILGCRLCLQPPNWVRFLYRNTLVEGFHSRQSLAEERRWFCHLYKIGRGFLLFFPSLSGRLNTLGTPLVQFLTLIYAFSSQAMLAEWNCNIISSAQGAAYIMGGPLLVFSGSSIRVINWVWWLILAEIQASTISYEPRGTFYSICVWHCHSRKRAF